MGFILNSVITLQLPYVYLFSVLYDVDHIEHTLHSSIEAFWVPCV